MLIYKEPSVEETSGVIVFYGADSEVLKYVKIDRDSIFALCKILDTKPNQFHEYSHIAYKLLSSIGIDLDDIDTGIRCITIIDFQQLHYLSSDHAKFFDFNNETRSFMKKIDLRNIDSVVTNIMDSLDEFKTCYNGYIALAIDSVYKFNVKVDHLQMLKRLLGDTVKVDIPDKIGKEINPCLSMKNLI